MAMKMGEVVIDFEPGASFRSKPTAAGDMRSPDPDGRHTAREKAVNEFRDNAARATQQQLAKVTVQAIGLLIQLRALGRSFTDAELRNQLREALEFMDDFDGRVVEMTDPVEPGASTSGTVT